MRRSTLALQKKMNYRIRDYARQALRNLVYNEKEKNRSTKHHRGSVKNAILTHLNMFMVYDEKGGVDREGSPSKNVMLRKTQYFSATEEVMRPIARFTCSSVERYVKEGFNRDRPVQKLVRWKIDVRIF